MLANTVRLAVTAALVAAALVPLQAQARDYGSRRDRGDYVVAESRFGRGTVSGPVRAGPNGFQVRLPGGTWIDCVRSCSDTLRRQSVDFWDNNTGPAGRDSGRGYFSLNFGF